MTRRLQCCFPDSHRTEYVSLWTLWTVCYTTAFLLLIPLRVFISTVDQNPDVFGLFITASDLVKAETRS